jgi:hypothetical protein
MRSDLKKKVNRDTVPSVSVRLVMSVINLPRPVRFGLVALLALSVTLALSPMVDEIYFNLLFDSLAGTSLSLARLLPSLITASIGLVMYTIGWWLIVGTVGETPQARRAILWYVTIGLLALLVVIILIIRGATLVHVLGD